MPKLTEEKREKTILTNVNYLLVILLSVFAGAYIYIDNKIDIREQSQEFFVPKIDILSSDEVAAERQKFVHSEPKKVLVSEQKNSSPMSNPDTNSVASNTNTLIQTNNNQNPSYLITEDMATTKAEISQPKTNISQTKTVYASEDTGITLTTKSKYSPEDQISQVFKGVIYSIDYENNTILLTLSDKTGLATIAVETTTKIQINGKRILLKDLKTGDKITAEGAGYPDSNKMTASVISINGFTSIIPTN